MGDASNESHPLRELLFGISVVIDDEFDPKNNDDESDPENKDTVSTPPMQKIVDKIESQWGLPVLKKGDIPKDEQQQENLLKTSGLIVLDWQLYQSQAGGQVQNASREKIKEFLRKARKNFVPIVILSNTEPESIKYYLKKWGLYDSNNNNIIFIQQKKNADEFEELEGKILQWLNENRSVSVLKGWERELNRAKCDLFGSMFQKVPNWPDFFIKAYRKDGVHVGMSLMKLINDALVGRMNGDVLKFPDAGESPDAGKPPDAEESPDAGKPAQSVQVSLKQIISNTTFVEENNNSDKQHVRLGDLFKENGKYLLNLRQDCDCVPRKGNDVDLYCITGKIIDNDELIEIYGGTGDLAGNPKKEIVSEAVVFSAHKCKPLSFSFKKLEVRKLSELRDEKVGRIIYPEIVRIQQRFLYYLQRQGIPTVPKCAFPDPDSEKKTGSQ